MIIAMNSEQALAAVSPSAEDVRTLTQEVWTTFLGEREPLLVGVAREFPPEWSASVTVKGEWNGMVALEMTDDGARELTRRLFGLPGERPVPDADLVDAVGELVNMIGGNVKGLVPGPSRLSLPLVAAGRVAHGSGHLQVVRLACVWAGEPLVVTVHAGRTATSRGSR